MGRDFSADVLRAPMLRIEIPADIARVQEQSLERAAAWRADTRAAFLAAMERRYRVAGLVRDGSSDRCFYVLSLETRPSAEAR
jgi:predicted GNAT superfamily acetyltransferase